jgi:hypothetical protein
MVLSVVLTNTRRSHHDMLLRQTSILALGAIYTLHRIDTCAPLVYRHIPCGYGVSQRESIQCQFPMLRLAGDHISEASKVAFHCFTGLLCLSFGVQWLLSVISYSITFITHTNMFSLLPSFSTFTLGWTHQNAMSPPMKEGARARHMEGRNWGCEGLGGWTSASSMILVGVILDKRTHCDVRIQNRSQASVY